MIKLRNNKILLGEDFQGSSGRYDFLVKNFRPGNVLDLGNVGGIDGEEDNNFSSHFKFRDHAVGSIVYGFDLSKPKQHIEKYTNQFYGNLDDGLPFPDDHFDTVYMGELIEHLHNFGLVLQHIRRVLKSDGVFILDTPNAYGFRRLVKYLLLRKEDIGNVTHTVIFTPASLISLLNKNGFMVEILSEKKEKVRFIPTLRGMGSHILIKCSKG